MEPNAYQDEQFSRWVLSETAKHYWDFDEHGQRTKLKPGWGKAQTEYNRILGLKEKSENDLKVWHTTNGIE